MFPNKKKSFLLILTQAWDPDHIAYPVVSSSSALRLLRFALSSRYPEPRMFRTPARLKSSYDVVIIGAGGHG